jgi:hypothetical protein
MPNAQLIIYPDSGHGSLFQYPELFLSHARIFLDDQQSTDDQIAPSLMPGRPKGHAHEGI